MLRRRQIRLRRLLRRLLKATDLIVWARVEMRGLFCFELGQRERDVRRKADI